MASTGGRPNRHQLYANRMRTQSLSLDGINKDDAWRTHVRMRRCRPFRRIENAAIAKALGLHSACFHWLLLESAGALIDTHVRQLLLGEMADAVVAGENVRCKLAVVNDAHILTHVPDGMSYRAKTKSHSTSVCLEPSVPCFLTRRPINFTNKFSRKARQLHAAGGGSSLGRAWGAHPD